MVLYQKNVWESVKPPQPDGLWKAVTMIGERFKPDSGEEIKEEVSILTGKGNAASADDYS